MKKVLMIARAFPPFLPVGHSIRVIKFTKYLPALGWLPIVLTIDDQKEYENTRKVGSETLLSEIQPQVKIYRTTAGEPSLEFLERVRKFGQRNWLTAFIVKILSKGRRWTFRNLLVPDRAIAWLPFALRRGRHIIRNEGIDVIFATCPPYSAVLIGACLKVLTGKPLILDYRDDWIETPWFNSKPKIIRMIEQVLESWAVKTADKVILVTEYSKDAFQNRYPQEPTHKFTLIPNGCDLYEFAALKSMPVTKRNSKFTIVHAGSLNESTSWGRSAAGLFQAVQNIIEGQPEMIEKLRIVFAGDFPEGHCRLAEEMGLSTVINGIGHLPHREALVLTKSADLLLAINYEGWATLIPGKVYEYWAVGGPPILLLSCPGAASSFLEKHHLGFTVDPSDVTGIHQVILRVYRQSQTVAPMQVRNAGIEAYDRQELTRQLAQVLCKVI